METGSWRIRSVYTWSLKHVHKPDRRLQPAMILTGYSDLKLAIPFPEMQVRSTSRNSCIIRYFWKGGRVVECTGLENRRCASIRGFESHPFRQDRFLLSQIKSACFLFFSIPESRCSIRQEKTSVSLCAEKRMSCMKETHYHQCV